MIVTRLMFNSTQMASLQPCCYWREGKQHSARKIFNYYCIKIIYLILLLYKINIKFGVVISKISNGRWKSVCVLVTERKAKLMQIWHLLQEVLRLAVEQSEWLRTQTNTLDRIQSEGSSAQLQALPMLLADVEVNKNLIKHFLSSKIINYFMYHKKKDL